jgi:hypothetical protein
VSDNVVPRYDDPAETARELARLVTTWRRQLKDENDARAEARRQGRLKGRALPGRGFAHIAADRREISGIVRALSYILGYPDQTWVADQFINEQEQENTT